MESFGTTVFGLLLLLAVVLIIAPIHDRIHRERVLKEARRFEVPPVYGAGTGFADDAACRKGGLFGRNGIPIGFLKQNGKQLRFNQDSHLVMVGPTGSGKSAALLTPAVLELDDHSLVIVDPKGEFAHTTAHHRAKLGPVYILAPYGIDIRRK